MRLKRNRIQQFHLKKKETKKDKEGGTYVEYGAAISFAGEAWPADGKVQAEQYGERLSYIYNMRINGRYTIVQNQSDKQIHFVFSDIGLDVVEGAGICLFVSKDDDPDYKIISIKAYNPLRLEVEKI
jgi:hypothetical protein